MKPYDHRVAFKKRYVIALLPPTKVGAYDGIQNPQHVAMAMMVEACEVLEHFQDMTASERRARAAPKGGWPEEAAGDSRRNRGRCDLRPSEHVYGWMWTSSRGMSEADFSDEATPVIPAQRSRSARERSRAPFARAIRMVVSRRGNPAQGILSVAYRKRMSRR